jgi:ABC-type transport system involved in multi-copper enzyme maturation permease subunit
MRTIGHVAVNVFKESVRDKVLYNLVVFAVLLIGGSYLVGQMTAGADMKIIKDFGLAAIATFGRLIAIFIGIGLVWKEVERRSIYALLAKPLRRADVVVGKYVGLVLTLLVNVAVMTAAFYALLAVMNTTFSDLVRATWPAPALDPRLLEAVLLVFVELMLLTAIALFFSTFSSPFLSAMLTLGIWVAGYFNADLRSFGEVTSSHAAIVLARALYYVLPNFSALNITAQVVHGDHVGFAYAAWAIGYALVYVALLLTGAVAIFARRDFK